MKNLTKNRALELVQQEMTLSFGNIDTKAKMGLTASLSVIAFDQNTYVVVRKKTYETHLLERENWRDSDPRLSRYQLKVTTKTTELFIFIWNGFNLERQKSPQLKYNDCSNLEAIKTLKTKKEQGLDPSGLPWNQSTHGGGMKDL